MVCQKTDSSGPKDIDKFMSKRETTTKRHPGALYSCCCWSIWFKLQSFEEHALKQLLKPCWESTKPNECPKCAVWRNCSEISMHVSSLSFLSENHLWNGKEFSQNHPVTCYNNNKCAYNSIFEQLKSVSSNLIPHIYNTNTIPLPF